MGNNKVVLSGRVVKAPVFNHKIHGESFYVFLVEVKRLSDNVDYIQVIISERTFDIKKISAGDYYKIEGQYRSYNKKDANGSHLVLTVNAVKLVGVAAEYTVDTNSIEIDGYICQNPVCRKTPFGRTIADVMLAVNRTNGKTDYIPCICWSKNAVLASFLSVGSHVKVKGRIQSREYVKKLSDDTTENRIAYEVSAVQLVPHETAQT